MLSSASNPAQEKKGNKEITLHYIIWIPVCLQDKALQTLWQQTPICQEGCWTMKSPFSRHNNNITAVSTELHSSVAWRTVIRKDIMPWFIISFSFYFFSVKKQVSSKTEPNFNAESRNSSHRWTSFVICTINCFCNLQHTTVRKHNSW